LNPARPWAEVLGALALGAALLLVQSNVRADAEGVPPARLLVTIAHDAERDAATLRSLRRNYGGGQVYEGEGRARATALDIARDYALRFHGGWQIDSLGLYCARLSVGNDSTSDVLARLAEDPRVESAQPVYRYEVQGQPSVTDPYAKLQPHHRVLAAHGIDARGGGVRIGIVDTGVDLDHPDLAGQVRRVRDLVPGNRARHGTGAHGTAVTGIIAARRGNGVGIAGIAPESEVTVYRACWQGMERSPVTAVCDTTTLASALTAAIDERIDVLNLSLAGPPDPLVARLVTAARLRDMIIVAVDPAREGFQYPAGLPGVVRVRAAGNGAETRESMTLLRPADDVLSTAVGGGYDFFSGVSMSTAVVTGIFALLRQLHPGLDTKELVDAFRRLDGLAVADDGCRPGDGC